MQLQTENYLRNRAALYSTLLERIPDPDFAAALREAVEPVDPPSDLEASLQELPKEFGAVPELAAQALDDLLKKSEIGQRLGKQVVSIRQALNAAEHVERVGQLWFQTLENKGVGDSAWVNALAAARVTCLLKVLKLRDDMDFHRFRLVKS